jgi:8-oxo-dGTP pyrophosphatase MutT (NUDIX family)
VTSRRRRRWIIPKGWPITSLTPAKAAAREAFEEAGVRGTVGIRPLGKFRYDKQLDEEGRVIVCEVTVFPLAVKKQLKTWPEIAERETCWINAKSVAVVEDEGLRQLIQAFFEREATKVGVRILPKAEKRKKKLKGLDRVGQFEKV